MLSVHLANIKSSGVYRFVFDKSQVTNTIPQTMRLVVGYSEVGPFNTVMYVKNEAEFREIYGNPSKKLERYGCYFHKLALQCLAKGMPILCLNLKDFKAKEDDSKEANKDYEAVGAISFSPVADEVLGSSTRSIKNIEVEKIYDTTRLWSLSPEVLADAVDNHDYITFTTTDAKKNSCTVFMRPSLAKGYDVTLRDWYNNYNGGDYPDYVEDYLDSLVSDYLVDVYIFRGQFTQEVASSPAFIDYFSFEDDKPTVKDYITNAFGEKKDALQALSQVEGSGFVGGYMGSLLPYFKDTDGSWLSIDLKVNNDVTNHNIMMYLDETMIEDDPETMMSTINLSGITAIGDEINGSLNAYYGSCNQAMYMFNAWTFNETDKVWELNENVTKNSFTYGDPAIDAFGGFSEIDSAAESETLHTIHSPLFTVNSSKHIVYVDTAMPISLGDRFIAADDAEADIATVIKINDVTNESGSGQSEDVVEVTFNVTPKLFTVGENGGCLARINHKLTAHAGTPVSGGVMTEDSDFANNANFGFYLEGYTYLGGKPAGSSPKQKSDWINGKFDILATKKGLREALTNSTDTEYRYIVDTFEGFPEDGLRSKLASIAKQKENAFVISNFPAMKTFAKDKEGAFSDANGFNTKYIAAGHNKTKNTTTNISLPSELNGASCIGFFTPLHFKENGIDSYVPSAALVSNNFMDKYTSRKPYYVVAGPSYGNMNYEGMVGPDYNFTREDLDNLETMGVNCMIYKPRRGTFINSNQTAKQNPVSGLSKINIVELIIYLQDTIADLLQGYQWELNTQTLRDTIKKKADIICEAVQANGGLYDFVNVCDETNNTDEVIDNEMVVLSTAIEPAKGAGKMVHELTIYRKGGMKSIIK